MKNAAYGPAFLAKMSVVISLRYMGTKERDNNFTGEGRLAEVGVNLCVHPFVFELSCFARQLVINVRYHSGGSMKLNARTRILHLAYMVYL